MTCVDQKARADLTEQVIEALRHVYDPELPVNVYDLGLIYRIELIPSEKGHDLEIDMTLTTANCPMADLIPGMAHDRIVDDVKGLTDVKINMVFDPPWDKSRMSEEAQMALDMF